MRRLLSVAVSAFALASPRVATSPTPDNRDEIEQACDMALDTLTFDAA